METRARRAPRTHFLPTAPRSSPCRRASGREARALSVARDGNERDARRARTVCRRRHDRPRADERAEETRARSQPRAMETSATRAAHARPADGAAIVPVPTSERKRRARALSRARWKRARRAPRTHELPTAPRSSPCRRASGRDARALSVARDGNESATRAAHARPADGAAIVPVPTSERERRARALSRARWKRARRAPRTHDL